MIEAIWQTVEGAYWALIQKQWRIALAIAWVGSKVVFLLGAQRVLRVIDGCWNFFRRLIGK